MPSSTWPRASIANVRALASGVAGYVPRDSRARLPSFGDVNITDQALTPVGVMRRLSPFALLSK